jgi:hypothetical protein
MNREAPDPCPPLYYRKEEQFFVCALSMITLPAGIFWVNNSLSDPQKEQHTNGNTPFF